MLGGTYHSFEGPGGLGGHHLGGRDIVKLGSGTVTTSNNHLQSALNFSESVALVS